MLTFGPLVNICYSITSSASVSSVGLEIDGQLDLCGPHDWEVTRVLALENAAAVDAGLTPCLGKTRRKRLELPESDDPDKLN
jgi:hypothetical protein